MGVPKKRTSKMRRDRRRAANSNLKTGPQTNACPNCKAPVRPHNACPACGFYKGRKVVAGSAD